MSERNIKGEFRIREYRKNDYPKINKIWEESGVGGVHRGDSRYVVESTIKNGAKLYVLEQIATKAIAGTAWLTHDFRRVYIHHFCIKPEWQGLGLSHSLCRKSVEFAESVNMQVKLEVQSANSKAVKLYKKYNFSNLGDYIVMINRSTQKKI